ncbi:MAG: exosome complex protein Rrp42 [Nanoarchaeota archaeon]
MSSMEVSNATIETLSTLFAENKRFDGRKLTDYRDLKVSLDVSNCAEGSARVILGKTEVIVGVKMAIGEPYPDSPEKGNLSVSADLLPLASPRFEMGPPKFDAIELPRLVDRSIRESHIINLEELCVKPGEKVWTVMIDIYPLNDDGNLIDAAVIGALVALKNSVIPGLDENGKVDYKHRTKKKIPLAANLPLSITLYKLGNSIILDPTREEQEACETKLNIGLSNLNGKHMIHSCQKGGDVPFTQKEIESMMEILPAKYDHLIEKLKKFL